MEDINGKKEQIIEFVKTRDYQMLNREPRFSCSIDSMFSFKIEYANETHVITTSELNGFVDGMNLKEFIKLSNGYIDYSYYVDNKRVVMI